LLWYFLRSSPLRLYTIPFFVIIPLSASKVYAGI
jgi:hypothetical protein